MCVQMAVPKTRELLFEVPILWWVMAGVCGLAILAMLWKACACCCRCDEPQAASQDTQLATMPPQAAAKPAVWQPRRPPQECNTVSLMHAPTRPLQPPPRRAASIPEV